jgi:hypothetical protein
MSKTILSEDEYGRFKRTVAGLLSNHERINSSHEDLCMFSLKALLKMAKKSLTQTPDVYEEFVCNVVAILQLFYCVDLKNEREKVKALEKEIEILEMEIRRTRSQ